MSNTSIKQLHKEINNAGKRALGYLNHSDEISDRDLGGIQYGDMFEAGNNISDIAIMLDEDLSLERYSTIDGEQAIDIMRTDSFKMATTTQSIPFEVKRKIETLFEKREVQYIILGLYHSAKFTQMEIAEMLDMEQTNVKRSIQRAESLLKKKLTIAEYDSIRWALSDPKPIPVHPREELEGYDRYTAQVGEIERNTITIS